MALRAGGLAQTLLAQTAAALGAGGVEPLWRHVRDKARRPRVAGRTWVWDDSVFKNMGSNWGVVGRWWSASTSAVWWVDGPCWWSLAMGAWSSP